MKGFSISRLATSTNADALKFFRDNGYLLMTEFLSKEEVVQLRSRVSELARFEALNNKAHSYGESLQRVWNLLNKGVVFHDMLLSPQIDLLMNEIFQRNTIHRKYFLSSFQANIVGSGARAQILHIDTPVPEPLPSFIIKANVIWLLDDFTETNGATEIVPKSHLLSYKPQRDPSEENLRALVKVIAPRGSALVTHGALWHRSGCNRSESDRMVLLSSFASSFAREISSEDDTARFLDKSLIGEIDPILFDMIGGNHGVKPGNDYVHHD